MTVSEDCHLSLCRRIAACHSVGGLPLVTVSEDCQLSQCRRIATCHSVGGLPLVTVSEDHVASKLWSKVGFLTYVHYK